MDSTILKISGLTKKYGTKVALDDVSFNVERGRIYGFIGENGAGKTTTIRAVTGLTEVTDGKVELFGRSDKEGIISGRKKMGCLVERPILALNKTARQNLEMQQLLYGCHDTDKIDPLLERVGLGDVKDKKVKDFSLGMKQRLGIAGALVNDPELLILDEPVNGLDPMGMVEVREILKSLCKDDGITIVISSHILTELYQLVTDYIIISHGRIIETISREELDAKCSSYIELDTDQNANAVEILLCNGVTQIDQDDRDIKVYGDFQPETISRWLFDKGILVKLLSRYEISLEKYYMELLGRA